jgi:DNA mismatch endonuclease, patch repair protein
MSRVRHAGTDIEIEVKRALDVRGFSYKMSDKTLPGSPDFSNEEERWTIFVHGCFWHKHADCAHGAIPKSNTDYWSEKLAANVRRDASALRSLRRAGFATAVLWECEVKDDVRLEAKVSNFQKRLALRSR